MKRIAVIGEILVEIMADQRGEGFMEPIALTGPFPSGAPAIFIDQVARLGQPCAMISAVGDDDFGRLNMSRLKKDGVDVSAVSVDPYRPTGSAFVRYRPDGSRDFVFNIRQSACGRLPETEASQRVLAATDHFHIMGTSLSTMEFVARNMKEAKAVKERGGTVSFDPNLRKELVKSRELRDAMAQILSVTDLFLPSGDELFLFTRASDTAAAVSELLKLGIQAVVHKQGRRGVHYYDADGSRFAPAFRVEEVDPTGAGDCFAGAFISLWLRQTGIDETLTLATAAGALAVTRRGPMEGAFDLPTLREFATRQPRVS